MDMKKLVLLLGLLYSYQIQASNCSIYLFDGIHFSEKYQNTIKNLFFLSSHPRAQDKELFDLFTEYKGTISFKETLKVIKSVNTPKVRQQIIKSYYYTHRVKIKTKEIKLLFKHLPDNKNDFNSSLKLVRLISKDHLRRFPHSKKAQDLFNRSLSSINITDLEWRMFVLSNW